MFPLVSLGRLGRLLKGYGGTKADEVDAGVPCIRYGDLYTHHKEFIVDSRSFLDAKTAQGYFRLQRGDVLFAASGETLEDIGRSSEVLIEDEARCGGDTIVFRPSHSFAPKFLGYALDSAAARNEKSQMGRGYTIIHIYPSGLKHLPVPVPSLEEQHLIAAFLDYETARIDELVREQERLREVLEERRSALTMAAVSGKLTNSEFKPSRVPWLPEVASSWDEVQIRRVAKLGTGHTPSRSKPEYWIDCVIPWVTTGEVPQLRNDRIEYLSETREKISMLGLANSSAVLHPAGTVFLSRTASPGFSGIMDSPMATSQDFVTWTCGQALRPRFLLLCLRAMRNDLLGRLAMGSTHKTIYMPEVEQLTIALPSVEEQDRIIQLTWEQLNTIDQTLESTHRHSELLKERRSAVITAAVTGQIDVRDYRPDANAVLEEVV